MVNRAVAHDAELLACADVDRRRRAGLLRVVAAQVGRGDVRDGGLRVVVVRHAHVRPLRRSLAANDKRGEGVCWAWYVSVIVNGDEDSC